MLLPAQFWPQHLPLRVIQMFCLLNGRIPSDCQPNTHIFQAPDLHAIIRIRGWHVTNSTLLTCGGNLADAGKAVLHSFLGCRIQKIMSSKSSWRSCKPLLCLIVLSNGGCTGTPSQRPNKLYDVRWAPVESWFDSILGDTEQDRLWKQGYGFNNPNAERIRKERPK